MINELKEDAKQRMTKTIEALGTNFNKIRTGRAHPSLLDGLRVSYYGTDTPLSQIANIGVEDARTLTAGSVIRIPMPMLTEETRKGYIKQARQEAESARVSIRNARRDVLSDVKELLKEKEISEDEERRAQDDVQKITDQYIAEVDKALVAKEADLMEI